MQSLGGIDKVYHNGDEEAGAWFQNGQGNSIVRWSTLALPLIIVMLIMSVLLCYNPCSSQTPTENGIDPRHLNMNNSSWLPDSKVATMQTKSLKFDQRITKATNLTRSNATENYRKCLFFCLTIF